MIFAPPIIGPLEFFGLENNIILVEHDDDDCSLNLLSLAINDKVNIIYTPDMDSLGDGMMYSVGVEVNSIANVYKVFRLATPTGPVDFHIIHRIDMMDGHFTNIEIGAQVKAYLSMMASPKNLMGANVIVTSCRYEWKIREIADTFISLRKKETNEH